MPKIQPAAVVRRTEVTLAASDAGEDTDGVRGFLAIDRCAIADFTDGRRLVCTLPPLAPGGAHRVAIAALSAGATAVATLKVEAGWLASGDAAVVTDGAAARMADGAVIPLRDEPALGSGGQVVSTWLAPRGAVAPLVRFALARGQERWAMHGYPQPAQAAAWRASWEQVPGEAELATMAPDGGLVALALRDSVTTFAYQLIAFDGVTGSIRWQVTLPASPLRMAFAGDGKSLAVVARDPARCESCVRAVVIAAEDGRVLREAPLLDSVIGGDASALGFAGDLLWMYRYVPAHRASELSPGGASPVASRCDYEAYDVSASAKPSKRAPTGPWLELVRDCQVRALIALPGGHLAAIQVTSATDLAVVELEGAP